MIIQRKQRSHWYSVKVYETIKLNTIQVMNFENIINNDKLYHLPNIFNLYKLYR